MQLQTVGEIVRVLRSRRGLEQVQLARACGWRDASAVSRIETDRIHPTRRTLNKLAENLAEPDAEQSPALVRSWLYLAAGILPTAEEVGAASPAPEIERWTQPAMILDFGWNVWRANALAIKLTGLPDNFEGRNHLEMVFEPDGSIRRHLGDGWEQAARFTVERFRRHNVGRSEQRWYRKLIVRLKDLPDFERLWAEASTDGPVATVEGRVRAKTPAGTVAMLSLHLTAEPRLWVAHIVPEDLQAAHDLLARGLIAH